MTTVTTSTSTTINTARTAATSVIVFWFGGSGSPGVELDGDSPIPELEPAGASVN